MSFEWDAGYEPRVNPTVSERDQAHAVAIDELRSAVGTEFVLFVPCGESVKMLTNATIQFLFDSYRAMQEGLTLGFEAAGLDFVEDEDA